MKEFLSFLINSIIGFQETKIIQEESPSGQIILTIDTPQENYGKVIGKKGKIINALRKLVNLRAAKEGTRVIIKLKDKPQSTNGFILNRPEGEANSAEPMGTVVSS